MRPRFAVLAAAVAACTLLAMPDLVSAAPSHNHDLTISSTPNPINSGDGVLVYGQLSGTNISGQAITLYQHVIGSGGGHTAVGTPTTTNSFGFYEFTEPVGTVLSNTDWFVRGPDASHSRTVHERVAALVSLSASATSTDTVHPITLTGTVTPDHAGGRVFLQEQKGSSDDWQTLKSGRQSPNSSFSIAYRWPRQGERDVRVLFRGDARNLAGASDPVTVDVQQAQVPGFTINSSSPLADAGSSVTIYGVLGQAGTSSPEPNTVVQLWGRTAYQRHFVVLADGMTGANGGYSFGRPAVSTNTVYFVATMRLGHRKPRRTAMLYQGVRDVLTMQASTPSAATGQVVRFTGTVMPDKAGHSIYLQKLGKDGDWHTVEVGTVRHDSTFAFAWMLGSPGLHAFRARVTSDGANVGSHSAPVTITAVAPPALSLPPAS
jgi:hypothetical protein